MTTDKPAVREPELETGETPANDEPSDHSHDQSPDESKDESNDDPQPTDSRRPSWWHRDHPTFAALTGFFTGLLFVALVPAAYVGVLNVMFSSKKVEDLFPFVLLTLVVPLALVVNRRTRRFGVYFWIGMVLTAVVVVGVGALVLWYLVDHQN